MSKRQRRQRDKQRRHQRSGPTRRQLAAGAGLTISATLAGATTAEAATFTVNSTGDAGSNLICDATCTLRDALDDADSTANTGGANDVITFASNVTGSITLGSDLPTINEGVDINGPGAGVLTVDGDANQIFAIDINLGYYEVSISDLTLTDGNYFAGAAILNLNGGVFLRDSVLTGNSASLGGAIYNASNVYIHDSTITNNDASVHGGGIFNLVGFAGVYDSTISSNYALDSSSGVGGGIANRYGQVIMDASTVSGNGAYAGGGGVHSYSSFDTASFAAGYSTFANNFTYGYGGAIDATGYDGFVQFRASTLSGNSAGLAGGAARDYMTGLYPYVPDFRLFNSTVAGNDAAYNGGGVYEFTDYDPFLYNTIVANNTLGSGTTLDLDGTFDAGFTLVEDPTGATLDDSAAPGSNITGVDPQLGGLAANGGPTLTHALAPTSPAVDQGARFFSDYDQRFMPRPFDFSTIPNSSAAGADASDIGAFELQPSDIPAAVAPPPPPATVAPICKGKQATIFPRPGLARTFNGTNKRDVVVGTNKKDTIRAKGGNDLVCAKGGKDTVKGGGGKDRLFGQGGKDTLKGGAGKDTLKGGAGKDRLFGQGGKDNLVGGAKNDTCVGGPGNDTEKSC
jgi:hypothetical protein